jgi:hypothetical protein
MRSRRWSAADGKIEVNSSVEPPPWWVAPGRWLVRAAIAAGVIGVLLALEGVNSPLRAPLVILFLVVAPAAGVAGLLLGLDLYARLVVAGAATLVINLLAAEAFLVAGRWSPRLALAVVAGVAGICMVFQIPVRAANGRQPRRHG